MLILAVFFFNDTATTEIYTLSLHDALPIFYNPDGIDVPAALAHLQTTRSLQEFPNAEQVSNSELLELDCDVLAPCATENRSEEHTSELQSRSDLVCRLLLEKKKRKQ